MTVYRGHRGVAEWMTALGELLEGARVEPDDLLDAGERVVALGHLPARARPTGVHFVAPFVHIFDVRHGLVTRIDSRDTGVILHAVEGAPLLSV